MVWKEGRITAAVSSLGQKHTCAHVLSSKYCFAPVAGEFVVETRADNMGCQGEIVSQSNVGKSGLPPTSVPVAVIEPKSAQRYSSFAVQLLLNACSTPPPTVQPVLVAEALAASPSEKAGTIPDFGMA